MLIERSAWPILYLSKEVINLNKEKLRNHLLRIIEKHLLFKENSAKTTKLSVTTTTIINTSTNIIIKLLVRIVDFLSMSQKKSQRIKMKIKSHVKVINNLNIVIRRRNSTITMIITAMTSMVINMNIMATITSMTTTNIILPAIRVSACRPPSYTHYVPFILFS